MEKIINLGGGISLRYSRVVIDNGSEECSLIFLKDCEPVTDQEETLRLYVLFYDRVLAITEEDYEDPK